MLMILMLTLSMALQGLGTASFAETEDLLAPIEPQTPFDPQIPIDSQTPIDPQIPIDPQTPIDLGNPSGPLALNEEEPKVPQVIPAGTLGSFQEVDIYPDGLIGSPQPSLDSSAFGPSFDGFRSMGIASVVVPTYPDTITVNKTASPTVGCRTYEVSLEINGTPPANPADVVIVIDTSGSMQGSTLNNAKQAAVNFTNQLLSNPIHRIALVTYDFQGYSNWSGNYTTDSRLVLNYTSDISSVINAINALNANGGTNTQAGFQRAQETVNDSGRAGVRQFIILMTDGVPTVSNGNEYGPDDPTAANVHTNAAVAAGVAAQGSAGVYTVGFLGNVPSGTQPIARAVLNGSQNKGYYETMNAADLTGIYTAIASEINNSATNAMVTDTISEEFNFITGSEVTTPSATVLYDEATRTLTWSPGTIGTQAKLVYKIQAKPEIAGDAYYETNDQAVLNYTDVNGSTAAPKAFPIPTVYVPFKLALEIGPDRTILLGESTSIGDVASVSGGYGPYTYLWTNNKDSGWSSTDLKPLVSPSEDTLYTLEVTDMYGCKRIDSLTVFVGDVKIVKTIGSSDGPAHGGMTFGMYPIFEEVQPTAIGPVYATTNDDGIALFKGLHSGWTYRLFEVQNGYMNNIDPENEYLFNGETGIVITVINTLNRPGIDIQKSVSNGQVLTGTTVTYTFVVTNTGNTPLTNVKVSDATIGWETVFAKLEVGESKTFTAPYTINSWTGGQFVNTVTVTADDPQEKQISDLATAVVSQLVPSTPPDTPVTPGGDRDRADPPNTSIPAEPTPLSAPVIIPAPVVLPEEIIPLGVPVLPKTGELPMELFYGLGGMVTALGVYLKRR